MSIETEPENVLDGSPMKIPNKYGLFLRKVKLPSPNLSDVKAHILKVSMPTLTASSKYIVMILQKILPLV